MVKNIVHIYMTGISFKTHRHLKHIFLCFVMLLQSSCNAMSFMDYISKPMQLDLTPPPGPPEYQAGYIDGCKTGAQENNHNAPAQLRFSIIKNPVFNHESYIYRSVWRSAYIYCYLYIPYTYRNNPEFTRASFRIYIKAVPGTKRAALTRSAPPGPPAFRIGWRQGCNSGKAATGKSKHRIPYKFVKDPSFIEGDRFNPEFEKGWETGFWLCQRYYDIFESPARNQPL